MNKLILLVLLAAALPAAHGQQSIPRDDLLKIAFMVSLDLKQMLNTPIPTDPDVKWPVAVRDGERGSMVLPETKLSAGALAKAGREVLPIGQLWLRKVVPQCAGQPAKQEKLRLITVNTGDQSDTAILCALGARKNADGKLELLVFGKEKEPLLRMPLKAISAAQPNPIDLSAELRGESMIVTLKLVGKYQASLTLVPE